MSELSREQAREVITEIRKDYCAVSAEERNFLQAHQPRLLDSIASLRRKFAKQTKILVDNLYSKETRFLYELVQNAEDNLYHKATGNGELPFLVLKLYPGNIVVESNEDGFNRDNVKAICSTAESTKANSQGYIGEKGIGFKSVFKIAKKVHIQSGPFSFAFEYTRDQDDDGLGIVTPDFQEFEELSANVRTRMTLTLVGDVSFEQLATDFQSIPDTLLMFLSQLQILTVEVHPATGYPTIERYSKRETQKEGLYTTFLKKSLTMEDQTSTEEKKYYIVKSDLTGLPEDAARKDKRGQNIDGATVVLAFPVDNADEPILEPQYTFAFLPLRRAGFKFLIQSDFVTQANREDVMFSRRNEKILEGVAEAFRQAVVQFCKIPALCYRWMRYLPDDVIMDDFWKQLWPQLRTKLQKTPLLEPFSRVGFRQPTALQSLTDDMCDESGDPLLPDLDKEVYLSRHYLEEDLQILRRLGTEVLSWSNLLARLAADLQRSHLKSKWKCYENFGDWRTRLCTLLLKLLQDSAASYTQQQLKALELTPLYTGLWRPVAISKIYFPFTDDVPIPGDIGLDLVHHSAIQNPTWIKLLLQLGVSECSPETVIAAIDSKNLVIKGGLGMILSQTISRVRYLFYHLPKESSSLKNPIGLHDQAGPYLLPKEQSIYFPEKDGQFSPAELFMQDGQHPHCKVSFLNLDYLKAVDSTVLRHGRTWKMWLEEVVGVRWAPQLCAPQTNELSKEFRYIIEHRSDRLLGVLKQYWQTYKSQIDNPILEEVLRNQEVLMSTGQRVRLKSSIMPFPRLKELVASFGISQSFPFTLMSEEPQEDERGDWAFLKRLGVHIEDDPFFYFIALLAFRSKNLNLSTESLDASLSHIYLKIQSKFDDDPEKLRIQFKTTPIIYVPCSDEKPGTWVGSSKCIWDGPLWLETKHRLKTKAYEALEPLIRHSLKIPDVSQADILNDLSKLKKDKGGDARTEDVERIYDYLAHSFLLSTSDDDTSADRKSMRNSFEELALVFVPHEKSWVKPSECVWIESSVKIPGKVSIADAYDRKKTFFTRDLRVVNPTAEMFIASLKVEAMKQDPVSKLKEIMILISRLGVEPRDIETLREAAVFPVKLSSGEMRLYSDSKDFFVLDTLAHQQAFQGKVTSLDFSLEDIRDARLFLFACGFRERFTSEIVEEVTEPQSSEPEHEVTKNLRLKAKAIVRCAVHYDPKRADIEALYHTFRSASVFVSENINLYLRISRNEKIIEGSKTRANFHLEATETELCFYLPKDEEDRELCFERQLPRKVLEFLNISDKAAESVIGGVFRKDKERLINRILDDAGVAQVNFDFSALDAGYSKDEPEVKSLIALTRDIRISTPTPEQGALVETGLNGYYQSSSPRSSVIKNGTSPPPPELPYQKVLENIVDVARKRAKCGVFETGGETKGEPAIASVPNDMIRDVFGNRSYDRDLKVGAAGELYVFEYLKGLQLPGFNLSNWPSSIRHFAGVHPDYSGIESAGNTNDLSDIQYNDVDGKLTQGLIANGHLEEKLWVNERPFYYIEVKATTSPNWREPFHINRNQERYMQNFRINEGTNSLAIYIVCRIFNVGRGDATGMYVYVDPETKRRNRQLEFTTQTWSVKPLWHHGLLGWAPPPGSTRQQTVPQVVPSIETDDNSQADSKGTDQSTKDRSASKETTSNSKNDSSGQHNVAEPSKNNNRSFLTPKSISVPPGSTIVSSSSSGTSALSKAQTSADGSVFGANILGGRNPFDGSTSSTTSNPVIPGHTKSSSSSSASQTTGSGLAGSSDSTKQAAGSNGFGETDSSAGPKTSSSQPRSVSTGSGLFSSNTSSSSGLSGSKSTDSSPFGLKSNGGGSFGLNNTESSPPTSQSATSGLFGSTSTSKPAFGSSVPGSSSLFGLTSKNNTLFGSTSTGSGLFGSNVSSGSLFGSQATTSSSLFGSTSNGSGPGSNGGNGGLFGSSSTNNSLAESKPTSNGLFGGSSNGDTPFGSQNSTGGLFNSKCNETSKAPSANETGGLDKSGGDSKPPFSSVSGSSGLYGSNSPNTKVPTSTSSGPLFNLQGTANSPSSGGKPSGGLFGSDSVASSPFGSTPKPGAIVFNLKSNSSSTLTSKPSDGSLNAQNVSASPPNTKINWGLFGSAKGTDAATPSDSNTTTSPFASASKPSTSLFSSQNAGNSTPTQGKVGSLFGGQSTNHSSGEKSDGGLFSSKDANGHGSQPSSNLPGTLPQSQATTKKPDAATTTGSKKPYTTNSFLSPATNQSNKPTPRAASTGSVAAWNTSSSSADLGVLPDADDPSANNDRQLVLRATSEQLPNSKAKTEPKLLGVKTDGSSTYFPTTTIFAGQAPFLSGTSLELEGYPFGNRAETVRFQSLTAKDAFREYSFEELRLNDYSVGLKKPGINLGIPVSIRSS